MSQDAYISSRPAETRCPNCKAHQSTWRMMEQRCTACHYVHIRPGEQVESGKPLTGEELEAAKVRHQAALAKRKRAGYRRKLAWGWTFFWVGVGIYTLGWAGFFVGLGISYVAHAWVRWGDG